LAYKVCKYLDPLIQFNIFRFFDQVEIKRAYFAAYSEPQQVFFGQGSKYAPELFFVVKNHIWQFSEYKAGYETLLKALNDPLKQIVKNAGKQDPAVVLNKIVENKNINYGYNAQKDSFETDMIKSGIIDPLKVTRTALENAVSVAAMLLTTEAVVTDKPEKKEELNHPPMDMGGMM
jgi:chaperonin GroEL